MAENRVNEVQAIEERTRGVIAGGQWARLHVALGHEADLERIDALRPKCGHWAGAISFVSGERSLNRVSPSTLLFAVIRPAEYALDPTAADGFWERAIGRGQAARMATRTFVEGFIAGALLEWDGIKEVAGAACG
jgi:hypothetical protein